MNNQPPPGSTPDKPEFVLFMSNRCAHSKTLLKKIKGKRELYGKF